MRLIRIREIIDFPFAPLY